MSNHFFDSGKNQSVKNTIKFFMKSFKVSSLEFLNDESFL